MYVCTQHYAYLFMVQCISSSSFYSKLYAICSDFCSKGVCYILSYDCDLLTDEELRYRTFEGYCNNLESGKTAWGSIERAFLRMAPDQYADG